MKYTLSKLLDKKGGQIKKPKPIQGVSLDVTGVRATAFVNDVPVEDLVIMRFEAHAAGLFLKGVERIGFDKNGCDRMRFQEWFLAYPKEMA